MCIRDRERAPGALPPGPPSFMARSFPLARFGGCGALFRWWGYFGTNVRTLIWGLSFGKCFLSIFFSENAFQIGLSIPEGIAPLLYQRQQSPKRASDSKRAINPGVQGRSPGPLSPHFSGEMGTPAGQAGPPGRCAPRPRKSLDHPKGTQYRTAPPPGAGRATGRCAPRRLRSYPSVGHAAPGCPWQGGGLGPA